MTRTALAATLAGTALAALLGASAWFALRPEAAPACGAGRIAGGPLEGGFELVSETGETVRQDDVVDRPTLVYFGYTFCPDVCPLDSARNAEVVERLRAQGIAARSAMISIDPERDTPQVLADWTDAFDAEMIGLTGTPAQVAAAAETYRAYFARREGDPRYYLMDHSTYTYLVLPGAGIVDFFSRAERADTMAERAACQIAAAG